MGYIIAIDQGTTSTRSIVFDDQFAIVGQGQEEFAQHFPKSGWVEHKPQDLLTSVITTCKKALNDGKIRAKDILALGITNQRETTLLWDKVSGEPIYNAIVWQDRRTSKFCDKLRSDGVEELIARITGLLLDPYFSATKLKWLLDNVEGAQSKAEAGELLFGTVDTYLIWHLTNGVIHATDATNASRTMLYDINESKWSSEICDLLNIPMSILPEVRNCSDDFGFTHPSITGKAIPITGVVGDQQSASIGQCCFDPGSLKSTYGTGAFVLLNTGSKKIYSKNRLLTTIAYRIKGKTTYAMEGSIFIAGAGVQWLRDRMKFFKKASDTEKIIKSLKNNKDVYLVPAFTGMGAPYWNQNARGVLSGLTRDTGPKEIIRSTIESVAYQTHDLFEAMKHDGLRPKIVKVDGGMVMNNWFAQFLSDVVNVKVLRPKVHETTALGAAFMAGLKIGTYKSLKDISKNWSLDRKFLPKMKKNSRNVLLSGWTRAIKRALIN